MHISGETVVTSIGSLAYDLQSSLCSFAILLLLRMVPMPPAINYLYGAMAPKFHAYFLSTLLGYLPGTVGTVLAAKGATVALPRWCYVAGGVGVLALVGMTVATGRRVSRQLDAYERRV